MVMGRVIQINTICRNDAKKLAPSGYMLRKKVGGFIAYESREDMPRVTYNKKKDRRKEVSEYDRKRYKAKKEREAVKYFPFKTKEAYLRSINKRK
jgi:hypothetical protein